MSSAGPSTTPITLDETPVNIDLTLEEWVNGDDEDVAEYDANIDDDVFESELLVLEAGDNGDGQFGEIRAPNDQNDVSRYYIHKFMV